MQTQEDVILAVDGERGLLDEKTNHKCLLIENLSIFLDKMCRSGDSNPDILADIRS